MKSHVSPLPAKRPATRRRAMVSRPPLLRFDVAGLPALEEKLFGPLVPPKTIAADADLLAAYLEARDTLTADVRRFWSGLARRAESDPSDSSALADLAVILKETGEAYERDAETARTPDWAAAAAARASLYTAAFRALRRIVRGSGA